MSAYIMISPRGFVNEILIYHGTAQQVAVAESIVNDHANAWAERVSASHPEVRRAKRLADKGWGATIPALTEAVVRPFRPQYIDRDGNRGVVEAPILPG